MNPSHWLEAAEQLVHEDRRGAPRQVNLRCAVSMTYYALFHWLANSAADSFAGAARKKDWSWTRVYRGIDHPPLGPEYLSIYPRTRNFRAVFAELM